MTVDLPAAKLHAEGVTDADGRVAISLPATGLTLWTPETPKLYRVVLKAGEDTLTDEMGFRTIETTGTKILLNGKPIVLHGICIHAEAPFRSGRVNNDRDVATLLGWVKELGANYVRLAHYPHDQRMTRAADRTGILVWSEVPVYWAVQFEKEDVFAKSQQQLHEEIRRDRDKASVILWSIANETPNNAARTAFLTRSAEFVHQEDPTRLVTAALLVHGDGHTKYIDDPLGKALDVIGFNEYIGWYGGTPESADTTEWKMAYDKPLITSEFGGGAKAGLHGAKDRALDRGVSGEYLSPPDRDAEQDSATARDDAVDTDGLPLAGAQPAGDAGRIQPQGAGLRPGEEEGGVLRAAKGVQGERAGPRGVDCLTMKLWADSQRGLRGTRPRAATPPRCGRRARRGGGSTT